MITFDYFYFLLWLWSALEPLDRALYKIVIYLFIFIYLLIFFIPSHDKLKHTQFYFDFTLAYKAYTYRSSER